MSKDIGHIYHFCATGYGEPISGVITVPFLVKDSDSYEDLKAKISQQTRHPVKEITSLTPLGYHREVETPETSKNG